VKRGFFFYSLQPKISLLIFKRNAVKMAVRAFLFAEGEVNVESGYLPFSPLLSASFISPSLASFLNSIAIHQLTDVHDSVFESLDSDRDRARIKTKETAAQKR
jgi:hypothetical protein